MNIVQNITPDIKGLENINESLSTHYLIYKITNNINGKYYIGQHKTNNPLDSYMGSGKLINQAERKYGLSSFTKEILFDFDNFEDMNNKEIELVQLSNCWPHDQLSYNMSLGGHNAVLIGEQNGMYGKNPYANKSQEELDEIFRKRTEANKNKSSIVLSIEFEHRSNATKTCWQRDDYRKKQIDRLCGENNPMYGKSIKDYMTLEAYNAMVQKHCENNKGEKNPSYDKKWMYNSNTNERIYVKQNEIQKYLDLGFVLGQNYKANLGKKRMHLPGSDMYGKMIKNEDIQKYLDLGYVFGVNPDVSKKQ